jgi:penicillin-binding protein 2
MLERKHFIIFSVGLVALIYAIRLLDLQAFNNKYKEQAERNILDIEVVEPLRGVIFDRYRVDDLKYNQTENPKGKLIVGNRAVFDIYYVPKSLDIEDTTAFCKLFGITRHYFDSAVVEPTGTLERYRKQPFLKQLSLADFGKIADRINEIPGIVYTEQTVRNYPHTSLGNVVGYIKEVDGEFLNKVDTLNYYHSGDLIGKSGLEKYYEAQLRGKRGVRYEMRNVKGQVKGSYLDGLLDTLKENGQDLVASIDLELQHYAEQLMQNKRGAVVAIEPSSGEILVMLSAPSYDPNLLAGAGRKVTKNYARLNADPNKLLFNRAIQARYPPGSTFKTAMALVGLHDKVIDTIYTRFACIKSMVNCHNHPGPLNVFGSIQHSCNPFYYQAYKKIINQGKDDDYLEDTRIGLTHWRELLKTFGLGKKLGIDLPYENRGLIPSVAYYDRIRGGKKYWKLGNTYSLGIGQGEMGVTPLQLANLSATIANEGWYIAPHLIKGIGDDLEQLPQYTEKHKTPIEPAYFQFVKRAMSEVTRAGTARRAFIKDIEVCGKTGTAQNPHGKDHSVFMAFAPRINPKIAIAVYVENAGFGGTWAAPVASLVIEKYLRTNFKEFQTEDEIIITRTYLEDYVLKGNLMGAGTGI